MVATKATGVAQKLRDELKAGKSLDEAATQAGVKLEKIPAFAMVDTPPGATPAPKPEKKDESPGYAVYQIDGEQLESRERERFCQHTDWRIAGGAGKARDDRSRAIRKSPFFLESRELTNKGEVVFYEWLRERRRAAGVPEKAPEAKPT